MKLNKHKPHKEKEKRKAKIEKRDCDYTYRSTIQFIKKI